MGVACQQYIRIFIFSYVSFLPIFISVWCITIFPEVIEKNLGYENIKNRGTIASYFFTSFLYGILIGCFLWPTMVHYISKKNCILLAMIFQGFFTAIQIYINDIRWLCFCRLICGIFHNLNTVGKDFIFEFTLHEYQQFTFSLKSIFGVFGSFIGPYIGYYVYHKTNDDFNKSSIIISFSYLLALILFYYFFYIDYDQEEIEKKQQLFLELQKEEENQSLLESENESLKLPQKSDDEQTPLGLWHVFLHSVQNKEIRGYIIVYWISNGVFKTAQVISIFFLEQSWEQDGLGMSPEILSVITFISFFPSAIILQGSPSWVPKFISYKFFIQFVSYALAITILIIPLIRDILTKEQLQQYPWIPYILIICLNTFNPKDYSPFINYILNKKMPPQDRTSINAVSFIGSTLCTSVLINVIGPLYSMSFSENFLEKIYPLNKYLTFAVCSLILIIGASQMRPIKLD